MKKYYFTMVLALGIIFIMGCSKDSKEVQNNVKTKNDVSIYEGDKRVIFDLGSLTYDMEYIGHTLQFSTVLQKTHKAPDSYINVTVAFGQGDGRYH